MRQRLSSVTPGNSGCPLDARAAHFVRHAQKSSMPDEVPVRELSFDLPVAPGQPQCIVRPIPLRAISAPPLDHLTPAPRAVPAGKLSLNCPVLSPQGSRNASIDRSDLDACRL